MVRVLMRSERNMETKFSEDKILGKIRNLLDRANHPGTGEAERELCIAKADKLMVQNAIDQALIDATKTPEERRKPVTREFKAWTGYVWQAKFHRMLNDMARTVGVKAAVQFSGATTLVGMQDDVDYVELLWTNTYFAFLSKLDPKWDDRTSFEHNVYNFKIAGTKWVEICHKARNAGHWVDWPDGGRLIRAYKRHCKIIGEEPTNHTQRHDVYRENFADGFVDRISMRLEAQRRDRKEESEKQGAGLVLASTADLVNEAYWAVFPDEHPDAIAKRQEQYSKDMAIRREQEAADAKAEAEARQAALDKMTERQREEFFAKEERKRLRDERANERYWEEHDRRTYDSDGRRAGRSAADTVDLARTGGKVSNNVKGEI